MSSRLTQGAADKLRKEVKRLTLERASADMTWGELLHRVRTSFVLLESVELPLWRYYGYKSWGDFVETELGHSRKTAQRYMKIWKIFGKDLKGKWKKSLLLPTSKMRALVRLYENGMIDEDNVEEWLRWAAPLSVSRVEAEIRAELGPEGDRDGDNAGWHSFVVVLTTAEIDDLDQAISTARNRWGDRRRGASLVRIVREWTQTKTKTRPRRAPVAPRATA